MQFQVVRSGWIGDYNDANTFLELLKGNVGRLNPSGYANPEYDKTLREAERETDMKVRSEQMKSAERILLKDLPIIPIYHYTTQHMVSHRVSGWVDNVMDVHLTKHLSLSP